MSRNRSIHPARVGATALVAALALLLAPSSASAIKFKLKGAGWGHGIGMSQWGTQGYAKKKNKSYRWILRHYYQGSKIGKAKSKRVRVLIGSGLSSVTFSGAKKACGLKVSKSKTYSASQSGGKVRLHKPSGKVKKRCGRKLVAKGGSSMVIGQSAYRGKLIVRPAGASVNAINKVGLDNYVKGVVPNESPSSWDQDALRAQAVAARSYVLATGVNGDGFDAYDDTRSQVYGGKATEQKSTNRAVRKTAGQVVISRGKVAPTFYFSTSGGLTEAIEHVWGGSPQAHLKSERDPHDDLSPYHRWKLTYSRRSLQAELGDWVKGKLRRVKVLKRGDSPRIIRAKVVGSAGSTIVSGSDIQIRLGLRSTWVKFVRVDKNRKKKRGGSTKPMNGSGDDAEGDPETGGLIPQSPSASSAAAGEPAEASQPPQRAIDAAELIAPGLVPFRF